MMQIARNIYFFYLCFQFSYLFVLHVLRSQFMETDNLYIFQRDSTSNIMMAFISNCLSIYLSLFLLICLFICDMFVVVAVFIIVMIDSSSSSSNGSTTIILINKESEILLSSSFTLLPFASSPLVLSIPSPFIFPFPDGSVRETETINEKKLRQTKKEKEREGREKKNKSRE